MSRWVFAWIPDQIGNNKGDILNPCLPAGRRTWPSASRSRMTMERCWNKFSMTRKHRVQNLPAADMPPISLFFLLQPSNLLIIHTIIPRLSSVALSISGENNFLFPMRLDEGGSYEEIILNFQLISIYLKTYKKALSTAPEPTSTISDILLSKQKKGYLIWASLWSRLAPW